MARTQQVRQPKVAEMGRVRKYKKFKSCDPFSKKKKTEADTTHDEPPDVFEDRERRDVKRKERVWEDDNSRELALQREAIRSLRDGEKKKLANDRKIEGKKEEESTKEFKTRIRQETRNTLRDELKSMTSTAKKRKERLKDRKLKRKGLPGRVDRPEFEEGFSSAAWLTAQKTRTQGPRSRSARRPRPPATLARRQTTAIWCSRPGRARRSSLSSTFGAATTTRTASSPVGGWGVRRLHTRERLECLRTRGCGRLTCCTRA